MNQVTDHPDVKSAFKERFVKQLFLSVLAVPTILVLVAMSRGYSQEIVNFLGIPRDTLSYLVFGLFAIALIGTLVNWRCPNCNKYLRKEVYPKHCSSCGAILHD